MQKRSIGELINKLEQCYALAVMNGDIAKQEQFKKALEVAINSTNFPKVSA